MMSATTFDMAYGLRLVEAKTTDTAQDLLVLKSVLASSNARYMGLARIIKPALRKPFLVSIL